MEFFLNSDRISEILTSPPKFKHYRLNLSIRHHHINLGFHANILVKYVSINFLHYLDSLSLCPRPIVIIAALSAKHARQQLHNA